MSDLSKCIGLADSSIGKVTNLSAAGVGKIEGFGFVTAEPEAVKRLYFDRSNPVPIEPVYSTIWASNYDESDFRCHLSSEKGTGTTGFYEASFNAGAYGVSYCMCRQYISKSMVAQTVSAGTIKGQIQCREVDISLNANLYLVIKLCGATGNIKSVIISGVASATEFQQSSNTPRNRKFMSGTTSSIPYNSFSVSDKDRLIIEIGYKQNKLNYDQGYGFLKMGNDGTTGDLPEDETTITLLCPWIEFSQDLLFASIPSYGSAWSTTTSKNVGKGGSGFAGDRNHALTWGGAPAAFAYSNTAEHWDGSVWSTTASAITSRNSQMGFGNASAAIGAGGSTSSTVVIRVTEQWNNTAWATTSQLPEVRTLGRACGTTTAGLIVGGYVTATSFNTRVWQGTVWATTTGTIVGSVSWQGVVGSTSSALAVERDKITEIWNGSSWSTTSQQLRNKIDGGVSGTVSDALHFGGGIEGGGAGDGRKLMEKWNGSVWSTECPQMVAVSVAEAWMGFGDSMSTLAVHDHYAYLNCEVYGSV